MDEVSLQFFTLFGAEAGFMIVLFLLTILFFPAHAKYAPSVAESVKRESVVSQQIVYESYFQKLLKMMKTTKWVFIVISSGMIHGAEFFTGPVFYIC